MTATGLSRELRLATGEFIEDRRKIVVLSLVAAGAMMPIALYQTGVISHLPEPPLPRLDADRIDAASEAYALLATPDAVLGFGSYAVTLALAAMGGVHRGEDRPWLPLALAGKVAVDALAAAKLTRDQWTNHRAFCSWCLLAASANALAVPFAIPEARAVLQRWRQRRS